MKGALNFNHQLYNSKHEYIVELNIHNGLSWFNYNMSPVIKKSRFALYVTSFIKLCLQFVLTFYSF